MPSPLAVPVSGKGRGGEGDGAVRGTRRWHGRGGLGEGQLPCRSGGGGCGAIGEGSGVGAVEGGDLDADPRERRDGEALGPSIGWRYTHPPMTPTGTRVYGEAGFGVGESVAIVASVTTPWWGVVAGVVEAGAGCRGG